MPNFSSKISQLKSLSRRSFDAARKCHEDAVRRGFPQTRPQSSKRMGVSSNQINFNHYAGI